MCLVLNGVLEREVTVARGASSGAGGVPFSRSDYVLPVTG